MRTLAALLLCLAGAGAASGASPSIPSIPSQPGAPTLPHVLSLEASGMNGTAVRWTSFPVTFLFANSINNLASLTNIEAGSTPRQSCNNAANSWAAVSSLTYLDNGTTATQCTSVSAPNLVTFANTAANVMMSNGTIAVALYTFNASFVLNDADIVFNPTVLFSTLGTAGRFDIQAVAAHEFGHAFGLNHSQVACSSMFATIPVGASQGRNLSTDDVAGINHLYATFAHFNTVGSISGTVTKNGAAVYGAHVVARSFVTGVTISSTLTNPNGTYSLTNIEAGPYVVYVEPLDGPGEDFHVQTSYWITGKDANFRTTFHGGVANPTIVRVLPLLVTAGINFAVPALTPTLNLNLTTLASSPTTFSSAFASGSEVTQGTTSNLMVGGLQVQQTASSAFSMPGSGVTFGPSSSAQGTFVAIPETWKIFPLNVSGQASPGPRDVVMTTGGETSVYCGVVEIRETTPPTARVVSYGFGCAGANGTLTVSAVGGLPTIPNPSFGLFVTGTVTGGIVYFVLSYLPDYVDATMGCSQWVNISPIRLVVPLNLSFSVPTAGATAIRGFPIPNIPSLSGLTVYCEAAATDPSAPLGFITSNGLQFTVR